MMCFEIWGSSSHLVNAFLITPSSEIEPLGEIVTFFPVITMSSFMPSSWLVWMNFENLINASCSLKPWRSSLFLGENFRLSLLLNSSGFNSFEGVGRF